MPEKIITQEEITKAVDTLERLKPKQDPTEALLEGVKDVVRKKLREGCTPNQITDVVVSSGLPVSRDRVVKFVRRMQRKRATRRNGKR